MSRLGRCTNIAGGCSAAKRKGIVPIPPGSLFTCPECHQPLRRVFEFSGLTIGPLPKASRAQLFTALRFSAIVAISAGIGFLIHYWISRPSPQNRAPTPTVSPAPKLKNAMLRIHGSNTIGSELAPALAKGFLEFKGAGDVQHIPIAKDKVVVQAALPDAPQPKSIEIWSQGSETAFQDLSNGSCDIGAASRNITKDEKEKLVALGDMTSPDAEHVLGMDGIAIIVPKGNTLDKLSIDEVGDIFSCSVTDWREVPYATGQSSGSTSIHVYVRDAKSGTRKTFEDLVLKERKLKLCGGEGYEISEDLVNAVSADPNGIGFVSWTYAKADKVNMLALYKKVGQEITATLKPDALTVGTEDYALSRRLFLYTSVRKSESVREFIKFAESRKGQIIVQKSHFVEQNPQIVPMDIPVGSPPGYEKLVRGAERLTVNIRFKWDSIEIDNKAIEDLQRIENLLSGTPYQRIYVIGFADNTGDATYNLGLSKQRAQVVSQNLKQRGITRIKVDGFGQLLPVDLSRNQEAVEKNRRVEIWVRR